MLSGNATPGPTMRRNRGWYHCNSHLVIRIRCIIIPYLFHTVEQLNTGFKLLKVYTAISEKSREFGMNFLGQQDCLVVS